MTTENSAAGGALKRPLPAAGAEGVARFGAVQWRQILWITLGAIALFAALRLLPTGTNLSHMDFRVDPKAGNVIEFCDPLNPQFIPVVAARSPVTMTLAIQQPAAAGREVQATLILKTGSGKPVAPEDLLVTHTRKLHLLIVDPTLTDYQHVHPTAMHTAGEWSFSFTPRLGGVYRVFGDFTPAATARGLYASADLSVAPSGSEAGEVKAGAPTKQDVRRPNPIEAKGVMFSLAAVPAVARVGQPIDLQFSMWRRDGGNVPLEPVMGAFAHLVAFDVARSGFAHLHPAEIDLTKTPDAKHPALNFKLTIPRAGRYVVWAQVNLGGSETFVPFDLEVGE